MDRSLKIALGSFVVSIVVLAIKYAAFWITGSVALFSDALESIINVVTAMAVIFAIKAAAVPPDEQHPYGHHKAEYLSAVVVGTMIVGAAIAILNEAYHGFIAPKPIDAPWTGMIVSTAATILNIGWSYVLINQGKLHRSASLVADGKHLMADVVTSLGVLIGVALVIFTGIIQLDAIIAALVALHVLWSGWGVIRESASGLLDEAAPPEELALIRGVISANASDALEAHALRTRHAGRVTFIDFHLVVPTAMTVGDAHTICDRIEAALKQAVAGAITTIHVEPEDKAKHTGVIVI
ncbi:cation diffusion facilitator family transporter [Rhizobium tumorigenes]|uniref:cation diffusion facilitator family transporter n=1 Tax=Rhizobium tumorigenes TaxID=2041385 RepID=UPI00241D4876|nr:cation diffusion facilitator family transporter [Rhizobium tumorigenes]WFS03033.1 cation diffusion facilitator family transporter [Rhizobium tumorigenes]